MVNEPAVEACVWRLLRRPRTPEAAGSAGSDDEAEADQGRERVKRQANLQTEPTARLEAS